MRKITLAAIFILSTAAYGTVLELELPATWDHFGAMRRGAWVAIHNKLADAGYELGFNDLWHYELR